MRNVTVQCTVAHPSLIRAQISVQLLYQHSFYQQFEPMSDNNVFPESKILELVISFLVAGKSRKRDPYQSQEPYLKRIKGLNLVCKDFYNSDWRNHPDFISCRAHADLVLLFHKVPQLKKIKLSVRATAVAGEIRLFQRHLLFIKKSWKSLSDVLPNLRGY
jgi:hypothetical protein